MGKRFEETIQFAFAALGGATDVAVTAVDQYLWIASRAFRLTLVALATMFGLVLLSEFTGFAALNVISVILMGAILISWIVLVFPIVVAVELGAKWEPVKKQLGRLGVVILAVGAFAFLAVRLPGGFGGASLMISLLILFMGLAAFGFKPTRKTLGVQMVLTALFSIFAVVFPQTTGLFGSILGTLDEDLVGILSPSAQELDMSLVVLTAQDENAPALFELRDGSPKWWCRGDEISVAGYRCFDQPGIDQTTQRELVPISPEIVQTAIANIHADRERRAAEEQARVAEEDRKATEQARLEEEQQKAEDVERQRLAILAETVALERLKQEEIQLADEADREREAYIQRYIVAPGNRDSMGVAVVFRSSFDNDLPIDGLRPFLTQAAINDGVFTRLVKGDRMEIDRLDLGGRFSKIVLGRHNEALAKVEAIQGSMKSVRRLEITVLDFSADRPGMTSYSLRASVLGQNSDIASQRSLADLKGQFAELWATLSE